MFSFHFKCRTSFRGILISIEWLHQITLWIALSSSFVERKICGSFHRKIRSKNADFQLVRQRNDALIYVNKIQHIRISICTDLWTCSGFQDGDEWTEWLLIDETFNYEAIRRTKAWLQSLNSTWWLWSAGNDDGLRQIMRNGFSSDQGRVCKRIGPFAYDNLTFVLEE